MAQALEMDGKVQRRAAQACRVWKLVPENLAHDQCDQGRRSGLRRMYRQAV